MKRFALAVITCVASTGVFAAPIAYTDLNDNVVALGEISPSGAYTDTDNAQYFRFFTAGGPVVVDGSRIDGGYDMSFWLFSGLFADTNAFGDSFDDGDSGFQGFFDDNTAPALSGPWGDPFFSGVLAAGWYTVAVTNYFSNGSTGGDGAYDFSLVASGISAVPEPLSLGLLGMGLAAIAVTRRRK